MSVESGFSTFRGAEDGLWNNHRIEDICTHEAFIRQPDVVNDFYNDLRLKMMAGEPNAGHKIVAELEEDFNVTVVTQNVDDLHERAGSSRVIHLHGEMMKACSSRDENNERFIEKLSAARPAILPGEKAKDGSLLRPFIVFFGEAVPMLEEAARVVQSADIFVVIGTSLVVYPAASLIHYVRPDAPTYLLDPAHVEVPGNRPVEAIKKGASEGLDQLRRRLRELYL